MYLIMSEGNYNDWKNVKLRKLMKGELKGEVRDKVKNMGEWKKNI